MNRVKEFVKKYDIIFVFFAFCFLLIIPSFGLKLKVSDELWNFSNVYKMQNGYKIYQDCNVIVTPLFFNIGKIFMQIFGNNMINFRIYGLLINAFLFTNVYILLTSVNIEKKKSLIYTFLLLLITNEIVFWGANYNNLAIAFAILGIALLIKNKNYFWQGLIIFLVFMTKQNIGIYYTIGIILARLLINKNFKKTLIETSINIFLAVFLLSIYTAYLYWVGSLNSFIDMAFLGIQEFAIQNSFKEFDTIGQIVFQCTMAISAIIVIKSKKIPLTDEIRNVLKMLMCFSIPFLMIEYPIFNSSHFCLAIILLMITYAVLLEKLMIKDFNITKIKLAFVIVIFTIIFGIITFFNIYINTPTVLESDKKSPYYGVIMDEKTKKSINVVCDYIYKNNENGKRTIIVSPKANLYFNVLKQNNNKFDLPFLGNLGKNGENGLISELDGLENTYILISREHLLVQESEKIINHIKENYEQDGKIDEFDIYKSHDM